VQEQKLSEAEREVQEAEERTRTTHLAYEQLVTCMTEELNRFQKQRATEMRQVRRMPFSSGAHPCHLNTATHRCWPPVSSWWVVCVSVAVQVLQDFALAQARAAAEDAAAWTAMLSDIQAQAAQYQQQPAAQPV
jgi:hypothetical protein